MAGKCEIPNKKLWQHCFSNVWHSWWVKVSCLNFWVILMFYRKFNLNDLVKKKEKRKMKIKIKNLPLSSNLSTTYWIDFQCIWFNVDNISYSFGVNGVLHQLLCCNKRVKCAHDDSGVGTHLSQCPAPKRKVIRMWLHAFVYIKIIQQVVPSNPIGQQDI